MEPASSDRDFIAGAFRKVLGYEPNDQEVSLSLRFLQVQKEGSPGPSDTEQASNRSNAESISPKAAFLLALLNHNDFITIR
jgi:hypothetical protein